MGGRGSFPTRTPMAPGLSLSSSAHVSLGFLHGRVQHVHTAGGTWPDRPCPALQSSLCAPGEQGLCLALSSSPDTQPQA